MRDVRACADYGLPTDNYSLLCDRCAPHYSDRPPTQEKAPAAHPWADETDGDMA